MPFHLHTETPARKSCTGCCASPTTCATATASRSRSAMHTDVPGAIVGCVDALAAAGVRYLSAAHNWAGRSVPFLVGGQDLGRPFWWRTPSGNGCWSWFTDSAHGMAYMEGNVVGLAESYADTLDLLPELSTRRSRPGPLRFRRRSAGAARDAGGADSASRRTRTTCCTCGCRVGTPTTPAGVDPAGDRRAVERDVGVPAAAVGDQRPFLRRGRADAWRPDGRARWATGPTGGPTAWAPALGRSATTAAHSTPCGTRRPLHLLAGLRRARRAGPRHDRRRSTTSSACSTSTPGARPTPGTTTRTASTPVDCSGPASRDTPTQAPTTRSTCCTRACAGSARLSARRPSPRCWVRSRCTTRPASRGPTSARVRTRERGPCRDRAAGHHRLPQGRTCTRPGGGRTAGGVAAGTARGVRRAGRAARSAGCASTSSRRPRTPVRVVPQASPDPRARPTTRSTPSRRPASRGPRRSWPRTWPRTWRTTRWRRRRRRRRPRTGCRTSTTS